MAIVISKSSGLNDDLWKPVGQVVNAVLQETDQEQNDYDAFVKSLANEKKSKKYGEKQTSFTSLSDFEVTAEGGNAPLDDMQEGTPKLIVHSTFQKRVDITRELVDDADFDTIRAREKALVKAYKRTRAGLLSAVLTGTGTTATYGGASIDRTTGDGKALFAADHKSIITTVADQSNIFTNPLGTDASMLIRLANVGFNFQNESGQVTGYKFNKIVLPSNAYKEIELVQRIIASQLAPGTANNDINTQKGRWQLVIDPLWQIDYATYTAGAPYILMSDEANEDYNGTVFYDRTPLDVQHEVKIENRNMVTTGYARMSAGFNNWRHLIMGGALAGTTLS